MRRAVTFARTGDKYEVVLGPDTPLRKHIEHFKAAVGSGDFGEAEELEIWTSGGRLKRAKQEHPRSHSAPSPTSQVEQSSPSEAAPPSGMASVLHKKNKI